MNSLIDALQLGQVPGVAGTIITAEFLQEWRVQPHKLPCDLVELRVDGFPAFADWIAVGKEIEEFETPVFATLRHAKEGGKWTGADSDRWLFIEQAVRHLSGVDVELESELAVLTARFSHENHKMCILSHHDFQQTLPLGTLRDKIEKAHQHGAIAKIAATVNTPQDLAILRSLLREKWPLPLCLIGMGPLGRETRLNFPLEGSCLTYGYLDVPGAPGQYSAAELMAHLHKH